MARNALLAYCTQGSLSSVLVHVCGPTLAARVVEGQSLYDRKNCNGLGVRRLSPVSGPLRAPADTDTRQPVPSEKHAIALG